MTTRVLIVNYGPEAVDLIVANGKDAIEDHHIARSTVVAPGSHMDEYVHDSQYLVVRERKKVPKP